VRGRGDAVGHFLRPLDVSRPRAVLDSLEQLRELAGTDGCRGTPVDMCGLDDVVAGAARDCRGQPRQAVGRLPHERVYNGIERALRPLLAQRGTKPLEVHWW